MKKCLKCECIYQDYAKKCPACGYHKSKKWETYYTFDKNKSNLEKLPDEPEEDIYKDIINH